jgi:hypothetical protein
MDNSRPSLRWRSGRYSFGLHRIANPLWSRFSLAKEGAQKLGRVFDSAGRIGVQRDLGADEDLLKSRRSGMPSSKIMPCRHKRHFD